MSGQQAGDPAGASAVPAALVVRDRRVVSWTWMVPLLAVVLAAVLVVQAARERGPVVRVRFDDGRGIQPGDALIYRGVRAGAVRSVEHAPDLSGVVVRIELTRAAAAIAAEGSRFWVVRPEVSPTRISGLETLLGPRYIGVEPGAGRQAFDFVGLPRQPGDAGVPPVPEGGLSIVLEASTRGSVQVGSPVTYRGERIGQVRRVALAPDATHVEIVLDIERSAARLVRANSKFWDGGAIGVNFGLVSGLSLSSGSLEAALTGNIALATPNKPGEPAVSGQRFLLEPKPDDSWLEWSPSIPE